MVADRSGSGDELEAPDFRKSSYRVALTPLKTRGVNTLTPPDEPLAACVDLEELDVWSTPSPKGLDALASLPRLRRITSHGALGETAIEAFRAKRPDVDVE